MKWLEGKMGRSVTPKKKRDNGKKMVCSTSRQGNQKILHEQHQFWFAKVDSCIKGEIFDHFILLSQLCQ